MKKMILWMLSVLSGATIGAAVTDKISADRISEMKAMSDKHLSLFLMMNQWVKLKQDGKNVSDHLRQKGYRNVAVYGMSYAGKTLLKELEQTDIHVLYGIDKDADAIQADVDVVPADGGLTEPDAIIVTTASHFREIKRSLREKVNCPIISLESILYK